MSRTTQTAAAARRTARKARTAAQWPAWTDADRWTLADDADLVDPADRAEETAYHAELGDHHHDGPTPLDVLDDAYRNSDAWLGEVAETPEHLERLAIDRADDERIESGYHAV